MVKSFKTILLSALIFLWSLSGEAQQIYQTKDGSIGVTGLFKDAKIIANSNRLFALINYETAEIELVLNPATLRTTMDSLNVNIIHSVIGPVILKGKLNIPYINTLNHPTYKLNFEAELNLNGVTKAMYITGDLTHIASSGAISCLLTLSLKLGLNDFGINLPEGWNNETTVQISQIVLKRSSQ